MSDRALAASCARKLSRPEQTTTCRSHTFHSCIARESSTTRCHLNRNFGHTQATWAAAASENRRAIQALAHLPAGWM
jgi:hypothetical protein